MSTPAMKQARAVWQATNSGHAISRKLTLVPKNADEDLSYEQRTLTYLKVDLYSGNPVSGTYLGSAEYNDANADDYESELGMRLFTDEGIEISEASFGIQRGQPDRQLTIPLS